MSENHDADESNGHIPHPGKQDDTSLSSRALRVLAMQELLIEKGATEAEEVQASIDDLRSRVPANGAQVVAHAWVDGVFKQRLLDNPKAVLAEMGFELFHDAELAVVENTGDAHHLVVCTLCSCYPIPLLGPPPDWYKSAAYRSRAVVEPRAVMQEFGLDVEESVEVRVMDSTADLRYLVLPKRPDGTEGMSEEELAALVTRDSMIGVSDPLAPTAKAAS